MKRVFTARRQSKLMCSVAGSEIVSVNKEALLRTRGATVVEMPEIESLVKYLWNHKIWCLPSVGHLTVMRPLRQCVEEEPLVLNPDTTNSRAPVLMMILMCSQRIGCRPTKTRRLRGVLPIWLPISISPCPFGRAMFVLCTIRCFTIAVNK